MVTKVNTVSFPVKSEGRAWAPPDSNAWHVSVNAVENVTRTRTGTALPKWREIIEAGGNATTPLSATFCSVDYTRTSENGDWCQWRYNVDGRILTRHNRGDTFLRNNVNDPGVFGGSLFSPKFDSTFVDNLARANFYKKVRAVHTQFEGYIFAGELMETLRMLRRPLVGIRSLSKDFLDTLRKRKRANPKKWLNDIGSAWLEQSFGWNPLLNDVSDAIKAYRRLMKPVKTYKINAGAKKSYDATKLNSSIYWPGGVPQYDNGNYYHAMSSVVRETRTIRYKGAVIAQVKGPSWQNNDLFGFEPENFIPAAWELLPWSFLADYFTNIGDILTASIVSTKHLAYTNRTELITVGKYGSFNIDKGANPGASWTFLGHSGSTRTHTLKKKTVSRSTDVDVPLPTLQLNFDLTAGQLANIDALLSQANALHPQHNPRNWHR